MHKILEIEDYIQVSPEEKIPSSIRLLMPLKKKLENTNGIEELKMFF
jgi:hypothetical protein